MATLVRDKMTTALICALALGAARAADPVVGLAREEGYEAEVESYDYAAALKAKLLEHYVRDQCRRLDAYVGAAFDGLPLVPTRR